MKYYFICLLSGTVKVQISPIFLVPPSEPDVFASQFLVIPNVLVIVTLQNGQLKGYPAAKLAFLQQNGQLKGYPAAKLAFLRLKELPKVILAAKKRFLPQTYTLTRLFWQIPDNNRSLATDLIH